MGQANVSQLTTQAGESAPIETSEKVARSGCKPLSNCRSILVDHKVR